VIWTYGISRARCVPKVFNRNELVAWCVEKYVLGQCIIELKDHFPISLSPQIFRKMLKLPEPTPLDNLVVVPTDITRFQIDSFKNPFREIAWVFTRLIRQESTTKFPCMIIYILYFRVKEQAIFYWRKHISIEISSHLSQYKKDKKFVMASYLVFAIAYCYQFPKLSICKRVNCELDPVTFWYQALWRHKSSFHFYEVFNDFVSVFKGLLFGKYTPRISDQENKFLDKKGTLEQMENHNVIRIFSSKENISFLPCHISDKMFITEVTMQYNF
jgi:hypothetical protein